MIRISEECASLCNFGPHTRPRKRTQTYFSLSANKIDSFTAARNYLTFVQDKILKNSDCHSVLLDDGNGVDIREWCAVAMNADSMSSESHEKVNNFFRRRIQIHCDNFSAEGMLEA